VSCQIWLSLFPFQAIEFCHRSTLIRPHKYDPKLVSVQTALNLHNAWNLTFFHVFNMFVTCFGLRWLANIWELRQRGATAAPGAEFKFLRHRCKLSFHLSLYRAPTHERACSQATIRACLKLPHLMIFSNWNLFKFKTSFDKNVSFGQLKTSLTVQRLWYSKTGLFCETKIILHEIQTINLTYDTDPMKKEKRGVPSRNKTHVSPDPS